MIEFFEFFFKSSILNFYQKYVVYFLRLKIFWADQSGRSFQGLKVKFYFLRPDTILCEFFGQVQLPIIYEKNHLKFLKFGLKNHLWPFLKVLTSILILIFRHNMYHGKELSYKVSIFENLNFLLPMESELQVMWNPRDKFNLKGKNSLKNFLKITLSKKLEFCLLR